ncbi:MAG: calcium/sodium antiporter [Fuerstiella sp.]|nr:calcium/sodium antiporter [Fuerstiella sp.]MCP4511575.1 calcium/sodium antiporter [Fuerstiella sp.]
MTADSPHLIANAVQLLVGGQAASSFVGLVVMILIGMVAITKGGDLFTDSSVEIARITHIPPVVVGATIVSMATSFPEFMVSLTGTLSGSSEFAVGNAIGSCLCNIGLIIGTCAIVYDLLARRSGRRTGISTGRNILTGPGMFMLGSSILTCLFSLFDSGGAVMGGGPTEYGLGRWQAAILFFGMFWYLGYSIQVARQARFEMSIGDDVQQQSVSTRVALTKPAFVFIVASAIVVIGSRVLVCNGEEIALRLGVPKLVLGLTLFAVGTSLPELSISLIAVLKGQEALGIGNIIGSNVLNICWVLASCALVNPLPIGRQTIMLDLPVMLLLTVMLIAFPWRSGRITSLAGGTMLLVYVLHLLFITFANPFS